MKLKLFISGMKLTVVDMNGEILRKLLGMEIKQEKVIRLMLCLILTKQMTAVCEV